MHSEHSASVPESYAAAVASAACFGNCSGVRNSQLVGHTGAAAAAACAVAAGYTAGGFAAVADDWPC